MVPMRSDEILTYVYIKPQDLWFPTEETPQPIPLGSTTTNLLICDGLLVTV
jgi:hypothetical protein